ncbi:hypothetical protein L9F63_007292 [Diploptera punctata]|uniref:non-specific serine/threonine protein kinase n=1 Tax=Diploptera punctata TaxID=6984 RepID=A0AAD8E3W3_DIPPU|nr:hypothetical protein L9F63_007292 [Diploptera punctata]
MEVKKIGGLEDYEAINIIGTGSFGTCYKVRKKSNGYVYVWKAVGYGGMSEEKKQLLVSEVNLLSELRHPNIVQYYDHIIHKETATLYIVMEWCQGGDLSSLINKCKKSGSYLDEGFVWKVLYQMCRALQACHWQLSKTTVLHRDIKPANVFLDEAGNVKLGDFGLARTLHEDASYAQTIVGTPYYMSPEVIKGGKYNKKSDIWSLGCLIYELCSLVPPFAGTNIKQLAMKIKEGKYPRIPAHYSDDLQKIISLLLIVDHNLRPTIEVILHHPTVVSHIAQETIKSSMARDIASAHNCDISSHTKEISNDKQMNDILSMKQSLNDLHISDENKHLFPTVRESSKNLSNEKSRDLWLNRIQILKQREASLRLKEFEIDERERALAKKEKQVALLDRLSKEKITRADIYLRQCREVRSVANSVKSIHQQRINTVEDDLDSTVSADPGDTSILPTSTKLKPASIQRPSSFVRSGSERRVHFDTLPFTKSKAKQLDLEITAKQNQIFNQHKNFPSSIRVPDKELYDIPEYYVPSSVTEVPEKEKILHGHNIRNNFHNLAKAEEDNYKNCVLATLNSNQPENNGISRIGSQPVSRVMSWKEERAMWLANKRQAYHDIGSTKTHKTANKENSLGFQKQRIVKSIGTSTGTVSSVPESGLGSLLSFR